jgi:DNA-binding NarL/FixJ family response regulator
VISKRDNPDGLLPSIETMLAGSTVFNETISQQLLGSSYMPPISLSKGETNTLDLLHRVPLPSNKEIARILNVSESTVESRVRQLMGKFVAEDRHHLVHQARCQGYEPGPMAHSPTVPPLQ